MSSRPLPLLNNQTASAAADSLICFDSPGGDDTHTDTDGPTLILLRCLSPGKLIRQIEYYISAAAVGHTSQRGGGEQVQGEEVLASKDENLLLHLGSDRSTRSYPSAYSPVQLLMPFPYRLSCCRLTSILGLTVRALFVSEVMDSPARQNPVSWLFAIY